MSETCITKDLTDINFTPRDVIGYSFEVLISKLLGRYGIGYNSNPLGSIIEWKKYQGRGVDFKIPELNIELEAKSGYAKIFKSWILRDWIPRFSYHNEIRIVIVKPTLKLSDQVLDLLFSYNINVIYPDSMSYLIGKGNKPLEVDSIKKYLELGQGNKKYDSESRYPEGLEPRSSKSSATFRDKFRTKLAKIGRLLGETVNLLRSLWYNRYGSMSLIRWIPCMKMKTDQKTKKRKRLFQCPFRITLICSYYKQFYACLIQIIDDYITRMERYGYGEEYIDKLVDYTILKYTWKYRNQTVGKCKCKAISFIDDEITSRKPRNGIAVTEPCLKFRCSQLIKDGKCEWLQLCSEYKVKPKQLKLVGFVNGDDTKWSVNHIQDIS